MTQSLSQSRDRLGWPSVKARVMSGERFTTQTPWVIEFADRCRRLPKNCEHAFGFRPNPSQSPVAILGLALRAAGIGVVAHERSVAGDRVRVYQWSRAHD